MFSNPDTLCKAQHIQAVTTFLSKVPKHTITRLSASNCKHTKKIHFFFALCSNQNMALQISIDDQILYCFAVHLDFMQLFCLSDLKSKVAYTIQIFSYNLYLFVHITHYMYLLKAE